MRRRFVLLAILVASLSANVYLWMTRPTSRSSSVASSNSRSLSEAEPAFALPTIRLLPSETPTAIDYTGIADEELAQRLARVEARIEDLKPSSEKFARDLRSPATEAKVKPYLDKVFRPHGGATAYRVECHGAVCKLESDIDEAVWMEPLQTTYPEKVLFQSFAFGREGTFIEFDDPESNAKVFMFGIQVAFDTSPERGKCIASNNARGDLVLDVQFDPARRTFLIASSGTLASQPVGQCLRTLLQTITSQTYVPSDIGSIPTRPIKISLPENQGSGT